VNSQEATLRDVADADSVHESQPFQDNNGWADWQPDPQFAPTPPETSILLHQPPLPQVLPATWATHLPRDNDEPIETENKPMTP
jgi:hypothetical protein